MYIHFFFTLLINASEDVSDEHLLLCFRSKSDRTADNVQPLTACRVLTQKHGSRLLYAHLQVRVFWRKNRSFWKHYGFLFPRLHARTMWKKPQKASHFHNVTADNAQAAVMSTRPAPTQAFSIGCPLSEQNVTFYLIRTLTVRTALHEVLFWNWPPQKTSF